MGGYKQSGIGWREYWGNELRDQDGSPWLLFHQHIFTRSKQFSQELQLNGVAFNERLNWTTGAHWGNERTNYQQDNTTFFNPTVTSPLNLISKQRGWGVYVHGSYGLTDQLNVSAGIRTSYEKRMMDLKTYDGRNPAAGVRLADHENPDGRWDALTWQGGLDYQATDDVFLYASVGKGFRSGGLNGRPPVSTAAATFGQISLADLPFNEEFVTAYEIGAKTEWLDNRVRGNIALFYNKLKDFQATIFVPTPAGSATIRSNAGSADVSGLELELYTAELLPGFQLNATAGALWWRFTRGPFAGGQPSPLDKTDGRVDVGAPRFTYSLMGRYTVPLALGDLSFEADWSYQSREFQDSQVCNFGVPCTLGNDRLEQGNFGLLNGRISLLLAQYNLEVALWAKNLLDRQWFSFATNFNTSGALGYYTRNWDEGRRVVVEFTYRFGSDAG
jgi:iron complex outermembrane receptor protein